jgi:signal transduction histidine kinase
MTPAPASPPLPSPRQRFPDTRWQRLGAASLRAFHAYARWLVGLRWIDFILLSVLLLIIVNLLEEVPPFSWRVGREQVEEVTPRKARAVPPRPPQPPKPPAPGQGAAHGPNRPLLVIEKTESGDGVEITIDHNGLRVARHPAGSAPPGAGQASGPAAAAGPGVSPPAGAASASRDLAPAERAIESAVAAADAAIGRAEEKARRSITIQLPPGSTTEAVREAIDEARREVQEALRDAQEARREALQDVREAAVEAAAEAAAQARAEAGAPARSVRVVTSTARLGDFLGNLALVFIFVSAAIKQVYKGQVQAEVKAAQAAEVAEAESLKRQVVEARMAAMQAQVEPHFLFNTLASIDHLIETDPPRASQMQKNLITLLRAAMPSMREANAQGTRDLGRELAVIRPYLEILKVRMEDRLQTDIQVPEGLHSAAFPPMMLQSLVENAIKHGLEPKPEGGRLVVRAEIQHGKLAVSVADTGLGFGKAPTAGTGTGLSNIRERLQLLYGHKAQLRITENPIGGTVVSITVPYVSQATGDEPLSGGATPQGAPA